MSKPMTAGQSLLGRVAAEFRANPASWARGWGYRADGSYVDFDPDPTTVRQMRSFCIDVALMRFGTQYGTNAVAEARQLLYAHMKSSSERRNIWIFNDAEKRTVGQVINFVEAAAGFTIIPLGKLYEMIACVPAPAKAQVHAAA